MAVEKFPAALMRSKTGISREDDFYLNLEDKNEFFHYYTRCTDRCMNSRCIDTRMHCMHGQDDKINRCTDKQIKFFNSVMDGKLNVVKHCLNIGSIRNDHPTMRAAIILACRFGQPQVLDCLIEKVHVNFFLVENLNFVVTIVAGCSEARRLDNDQEPSGILDVLIKYDREGVDSAHLKQTGAKRRGKFEFTCIIESSERGKNHSTPFMELCGTKSKCMASVIRKILDSALVDINQRLGRDGGRGSALSHVIATGELQVLKMVLDEMIWESSNPLGRSNQQELQFELVSCMFQLSNPITKCAGPHNSGCSGCTYQLPFPLREDRMEVLQLLMNKCLRVTRENKIGYENENLKNDLQNLLSNHVHDHLTAMMFNVIEEERRIAHGNEKITVYDLEIVKGPKGTRRYNFHGDQFDRYLRSINEGSVFIEDELFEDILEDYQNRKCWSCGDRDSELLKCKQCRKARYCDALCQEEGWNKHQDWCHQQKALLKKKCQGKTQEEKKMMKAKFKSAGRAFQELCLKVECGDC